MLNNWYILLFYVQFITSISSFNHCDAIGKSEKNFTGQTVVFVQLLDDTSQKIEQSLQSFFECYATDLKILNIIMKSAETGDGCEVIKPSVDGFSQPDTKWQFIISPFLFFTNCTLETIKSEVLKVAPTGFDHHFEILGICKNKLECQLVAHHLPNNDNIDYRLLDKTNKVYEKLEAIVDKKEIKPDKLSHKYQYFSDGGIGGISKNLRIFAIMAVILIFTFAGFFICLYSLLSLALVEEDFHTRNDEREFLMGLARAQNYQNDTVQEEMAPSQQIEELPILDGNTDVHTERTQSTTRSPMSLKSTQMSELEPMLKRK